MNVGDYGEFQFTCKYGNKKNWFRLHAEVKASDNKYVILQDNDGYEYLVNVKDIEKFKPGKKPVS